MSLAPRSWIPVTALALLLACGDSDPEGGAPGGSGFAGDGGAGAGGSDAGGSGGTGGDGGQPGGSGGELVPTLLGNGKPMELVTIADADDGLDVPRDLAFHPDRAGELWIVSRADDGATIVFDATTKAERTQHRVDGYALHFMEEVSSIAMGARNYNDDRSFGTCQESRNTYNGQAPANDFMGPALWSADLDVFAVANPIGLGSHLDMLHHSPLCMGIAHERDNVYWVFDGLNGAIVRYDFREDHDAGYDDHSDGVIRFLDEPSVRRLADIPSHLVLDPAAQQLYVADASGGRVLRIDITSGAFSRSIDPIEPGTTVEEWTGITWTEFLEAGRLQIPSGIALHDGILYVGDNATGVIHAFDLDGEKLDLLATGARDLMGIEVGPDDRLYFVDARENRVMRVQPAEE